MKLLRLEAEGFSLFKEGIKLDFFTDQKVADKDKDAVDNLFGNIYTNNVMPFVGINASGKTSILKVISFAIDILNGEPINTDKNKRVLKGSDRLNITLFFYDEKERIYKLDSIIERKKDNNIDVRYAFVSEKMLIKKKTSVKTKKYLLDFNDNVVIDTKERDNDEEYLKEDISISVSISKGQNINVLDVMVLTDHNLPLGGFYPKEITSFLDPSIDYIKDIEKGIEIKFKGREKITVSNPEEFKYYLSSGTIKGINMFAIAVVMFHYGGYVIVDEIENHFNKEIVATLIKFFMSKSTNTSNATLIFSTHYPELLDRIDRNDCIYIMRNRDGLTLQRLSDVLKRNDIKKSEVFQSNYLEGTAPLYDTYVDLKQAIEKGTMVEDDRK